MKKPIKMILAMCGVSLFASNVMAQDFYAEHYTIYPWQQAVLYYRTVNPSTFDLEVNGKVLEEGLVFRGTALGAMPKTLKFNLNKDAEICTITKVYGEYNNSVELRVQNKLRVCAEIHVKQ